MPNELEKPDDIRRREGTDGGPLHFTARNARLDARDVLLGEGITLDEIRLTGSGIVYRAGPQGSLKIDALDAAIVVTEAEFNRFLERNTEEPFSNLQAALLNGKLRLSGRYRMLLPIPFTITAVPEIEGGARLRLDSKQMSLIGAPIPGFGVEMIGEKINAQLSKAFDANNLPIPVRLTQLKVETGRFLLQGTTSFEISGK